ncbi:MAG: hypothetical protein K0Q76_1703 [Panacagrimonas sp.]|jgi:hypothetical protein|nr:hypothetical protein [Panacagrimonas sp.]
MSVRAGATHMFAVITVRTSDRVGAHRSRC